MTSTLHSELVPHIVETARLTLRPFVMEDLNELSVIHSDPEVMRFIGPRRPMSRDETRVALETILGHWNRHSFGLWAAVVTSSQALIGFCGLCYLDGTDEIEVGYRLSRAHWGSGLATEGSLASLRFAFEVMRLDRVVGVVDPLNFASRHVLEKSGLRYERNGFYYGRDLQYLAIERHQYERGAGHFETRPA